MKAITPQAVVTAFSATDALVAEEVGRINSLIEERMPFSRNPLYFDLQYGKYRIRMDSGDKAFMEMVAEQFRQSGWTVEILHDYDATASWHNLTLGSEVLTQLPKVEVWWKKF